MSTTLGLHDPTRVRVHKLSTSQNAFAELNLFLGEHVAMVILGEFDYSGIHITSANDLCIRGLDNQAVLWIKDPDLIAAVSPSLQIVVARFSAVDFGNVLAITFKPKSAEVAYIIEKNPANHRRKMSKAEMFKAFSAALSATNNGPTI